MAGGAVTMAEDFPIIENTIHGWIVGYYCDRILQEWSQSFEPWSTNHIKLGTYIDSISSVTSFNNEVQYKLELICWLPKLFRLEKQENEEPFLKIIQSLDAIKDIYPESFLEETTEFFTQLKKQCILLCSQEVGFVAAKNLSKKLASESKLNKVGYSLLNQMDAFPVTNLHLFPIKEELLQQSRVLSSPSKRREDETGTTDEGEEQSHVLSSPSERGVDETETTDKGVSKTTDADQKKLQNNIRDDISSLISAYLKKYLLTGSTAFLVQAASRALETEKKDSSGIVDSQKKIRLSPELLSTAASKLLDKDTLSQTLYLKDEDNRHYKERLHDIWEKSRAEYFKKVQNFEENAFTHPEAVVPSKQHSETSEKPNPKTKDIQKKLQDLASPVNDRYPQLPSLHVRKSLKYNQPPKTKSSNKMHRKVWTEEQEEEFYQAVKLIGVGKWADIRDHLGTHRSNVNLKDKWRSFIQTGKMKALKNKFGHVSS